MPSQPMVMAAATGDGGTPSTSRRPMAIGVRPLLRTRSAPTSCLPSETHQTAPELFSSAWVDPPAVGYQIGGDEEHQQTGRLLQHDPATPPQNYDVLAGLGGPVGACGAAEEEADKGEQWPTEMRGSLLVVASLLASVTYQAGMNPPGGVWQDTSSEGTKDPHRAGNPVLQDTDVARYTLFTVFNGFAFAYSVGTMMQLITESVVAGWPGGPRRVRSLLGFGSVRRMKCTMIASLLFLAVAFAAGSCRNWWCSLGAVFSPLCYFLSCVAFDMLYVMFRRRQRRRVGWTPPLPPPAEQVELAVENHVGRDDHVNAL